MNNDERISLNYQKIEDGLHRPVEHYSIVDTAFSNPKQAVIERASRLLSDYEVDSLFSELPKKIHLHLLFQMHGYLVGQLKIKISIRHS